MMEFCLFVGLVIYSIVSLFVLYILVDWFSEKIFSHVAKILETDLETMSKELSEIEAAKKETRKIVSKLSVEEQKIRKIKMSNLQNNSKAKKEGETH